MGSRGGRKADLPFLEQITAQSVIGKQSAQVAFIAAAEPETVIERFLSNCDLLYLGKPAEILKNVFAVQGKYKGFPGHVKTAKTGTDNLGTTFAVLE